LCIADRPCVREAPIDSPPGPEDVIAVLGSSVSSAFPGKKCTTLLSNASCNTEHGIICSECNSRICNCATSTASASTNPAPTPNSVPSAGCSDSFVALFDESEPTSASTYSNQGPQTSSGHSSKRPLLHNGNPCKAAKRQKCKDSTRIKNHGHTLFELTRIGSMGEPRDNQCTLLNACSDVVRTNQVIDTPETFEAKRRRLQVQLCRYAPVGRPLGGLT
jgi:hypothetical protein